MNNVEPYVVRLFREHGPMTARDVAKELGLAYNFARAKVAHAKRRKLIHVHSWTRSQEGCKILRLCAVYDIGNKPHAPKPPPFTPSEAAKRHRAKKARMVMSIFSAATPVDARRLTNRKRPDVAARWARLKEAA